MLARHVVARVPGSTTALGGASPGTLPAAGTSPAAQDSGRCEHKGQVELPSGFGYPSPLPLPFTLVAPFTTSDHAAQQDSPATLVTELRPLPAADPRSPPLPPVGSTPLPPRSQDVARISGSRNRIPQGNDRKAACRGALVSQCCCGARSAFDTEPCSTFGLPASSAAASVSALGSSEPAMASSARPVQRTDALHAMKAHSDSPWLSAFSSFASSGLLKSYQGLRGLWT